MAGRPYGTTLPALAGWPRDSIPDPRPATLPCVAATPRQRGRGWFITIEGPEGAGKTSQADRLVRVANSAGLRPVLVREPGGTPVGERLRRVLLDSDPADTPIGPRTDALLFNAARAQLVTDLIEPALAAGDLVISTRFADSTIAYQGYGAGLSLEELRALERFATGGLRPDLTILLDLPVEVGLARKRDTEVTRFEAAFDLTFHRRVRRGFLELAADEPERFVVIDGGSTPEVVEAAILAAVLRLTGPWPLAVTGAGSTDVSAGPAGGAGEPVGPLERIPQ